MKETHTEYINVSSNSDEKEKYEQLSMFETSSDFGRKD